MQRNRLTTTRTAKLSVVVYNMKIQKNAIEPSKRAERRQLQVCFVALTSSRVSSTATLLSLTVLDAMESEADNNSSLSYPQTTGHQQNEQERAIKLMATILTSDDSTEVNDDDDESESEAVDDDIYLYIYL